MKDKPYPISGHCAFYPYRDSFIWDDTLYWDRHQVSPAPLLAPKRVVKRPNKKKKAHK